LRATTVSQPSPSSFSDAAAEPRWSAVAGNLDRFAPGERLENVVLQTRAGVAVIDGLEREDGPLWVDCGGMGQAP
jgi:hypothetical protein